ncbi:MAG TPA: glycosyltransferase, partial [Caulobacteraceae bacterium]|nr:glycosyltransferase [Caulobacteraceae bacterium]
MSAGGVWLKRFGSRWRKWMRDPAAFCAELPSPSLRATALGGLRLGTQVSDIFDGADRSARRAWRLQGVELLQIEADARRFQFLTRGRASPQAWPWRALVGPAPKGVQAIAVAHGPDGEMSAAEVGPGPPGLLTLAGRPVEVRLYRTDEGGELPARLPVRPIGRGALVRARVADGWTLAQALREAWPPFERRTEGPSIAAYQAWIAANEPGTQELQAIAAWAAHAPSPPTIAVVMPVHDPRPEHLEAAIASVQAQAYPAWALCIADDGSRSESVKAVLRQALGDARVRLVSHAESKGVAAATNAALALVQEEVVVFLDHDDVLAPHALAVIGRAFADHPEAVAVYSDEDSLDAHGRRSEPRFKPDLDRERLLAQNYVNHAFAIRTPALRRLGGLREGLEGAQDHDLALRVADSELGPILHVPHVLYHWRIFP